MIKKEYSIKDFDEKAIVWEAKRQKDILEILDEALENVEEFGWEHIFQDDSFYIEYADGTTYTADFMGECGIYKKKGIERIIYTNCTDTQVYGDYEVNEYGNVS